MPIWLTGLIEDFVEFVAPSDDMLIYALQKWEQFSLVYSLSL